MTYTQHGHHIFGTPRNEPLPNLRARCGSFLRCNVCIEDSKSAVLDLDPQIRAKAMVYDYIKEKVEREGVEKEFYLHDILITWFNCSMGSWTAILTSGETPEKYYEVSYGFNRKSTRIIEYSRTAEYSVPF